MNVIKNLYKLNQTKAKEKKKKRKEGSKDPKESANVMKGVLNDTDIYDNNQSHNFYRWILKPVGK